MRLDLTKIDERISKLQEIKRIASDPELIRMLLEFVALDETKSGIPEVPLRGEEKMLAMAQSAAGTPANSQDEDEAGKLLSAIADGRDTKSGWRMKRG